MNRRTFLVATAVSATFAGCGGETDDEDSDDEATEPTTLPGAVRDCSIAESTGTVESTPVTVDGTFEDARAVLNLRWNARAQQSVKNDPDDRFGSEADPGNKYVVFRLEVTNTADDVHTVDEFNFELSYETADVVETVSSAINGIEEIDANIKAGGTVSGILTFILPSDATSATLQVKEANFPDREPLAFDPECDSALSMDAPTLDGD